MKRQGFTLVELLAVIVILALLAAIAIPSALKIGNRVKERSYATKIKLIEDGASGLGSQNLASTRRGQDFIDGTSKSCTFGEDSDGNIKVNYNIETTPYSDGETLGTDAAGNKKYRCVRVSVEQLVKSHALNWDETEACDGAKTGCTDDYQNIVKNPTNGNIINKCYAYIYYKNSRVYAVFDRVSCDNKVATASLASNGQEYEPYKE